MITKKEFNELYIEVEQSVNEAFDFLRQNARESAYITFLAEGEYHEPYKRAWTSLNPYTIDYRGDKYKDDTRLRFFLEYMRLIYSFPEGVNEVLDNEYSITMELMIYTHVWESKPYLKQLYRMSELVEGKAYPWDVIVPEMSKHEFIRQDIRDRLSLKGLSIADIITNGFHTSLRNAFAHSEYSLDEKNKRIVLDTFKGAPWDIREISFDDWSLRFAYTSILSYHFSNIKALRRQALVKEFSRPFIIIHPKDRSTVRAREIFYDESFDSFSFYDFN